MATDQHPSRNISFRDDARHDRSALEGKHHISVIDPNGDVCLRVEGPALSLQFQVSSDALRRASRYFANLLDPDRFQEGVTIAQELSRVHLSGGPEQTSGVVSLASASLLDSALPVLTVTDVETPTFSAAVEVLTYFLECVHGREDRAWLVKRPFRFIFSLAVVADRFFARDILQTAMEEVRQAREHALRQPTALRSRKSETNWRQRILLGIWYDFDDWVLHYSHLLIVHGSLEWVEGEDASGDQGVSALWKNLPEGIEDELLVRRRCIIQTIASLQDHLVGRYLSNEPQCRLGYDTSPQCDLFQLGQALRSLSRKWLVDVRSTLPAIGCYDELYEPSGTTEAHDAAELNQARGGKDAGEPPSSLLALCASLRAMPAYQLDANHVYCGVRVRLLPLLERIEALVASPRCIGLCLPCWHIRRGLHEWSAAPRSDWAMAGDRYAPPDRPDPHAAHLRARVAMFTAGRRDWGVGTGLM